MFGFPRAAGLTAAMLLALAGGFYATPSRAWDFDAPAITLPAPALAALPPVVAEPPAPAAAEPVAKAALAEAVEPAEHRSLTQMVRDLASSQTRDRQHECLAGAVYFESKGEPLKGQLSVAEVILNRARSGRFPRSLCGVVTQPGQFSFIRGGRFPAIPRSSAAWRTAVAVARVALQDLADSPAPKALFFHARRVSPGWKLTRIAAVGNHIFYR